MSDLLKTLSRHSVKKKIYNIIKAYRISELYLILFRPRNKTRRRNRAVNQFDELDYTRSLPTLSHTPIYT